MSGRPGASCPPHVPSYCTVCGLLLPAVAINRDHASAACQCWKRAASQVDMALIQKQTFKPRNKRDLQPPPTINGSVPESWGAIVTLAVPRKALLTTPFSNPEQEKARARVLARREWEAAEHAARAARPKVDSLRLEWAKRQEKLGALFGKLASWFNALAGPTWVDGRRIAPETVKKAIALKRAAAADARAGSSAAARRIALAARRRELAASMAPMNRQQKTAHGLAQVALATEAFAFPSAEDAWFVHALVDLALIYELVVCAPALLARRAWATRAWFFMSWQPLTLVRLAVAVAGYSNVAMWLRVAACIRVPRSLTLLAVAVRRSRSSRRALERVALARGGTPESESAALLSLDRAEDGWHTVDAVMCSGVWLVWALAGMLVWTGTSPTTASGARTAALLIAGAGPAHAEAPETAASAAAAAALGWMWFLLACGAAVARATASMTATKRASSLPPPGMSALNCHHPTHDPIDPSAKSLTKDVLPRACALDIASLNTMCRSLVVDGSEDIAHVQASLTSRELASSLQHARMAPRLNLLRKSGILRHAPDDMLSSLTSRADLWLCPSRSACVSDGLPLASHVLVPGGAAQHVLSIVHGCLRVDSATVDHGLVLESAAVERHRVLPHIVADAPTAVLALRIVDLRGELEGRDGRVVSLECEALRRRWRMRARHAAFREEIASFAEAYLRLSSATSLDDSLTKLSRFREASADRVSWYANKLVTIYGAPPWRALTISVRDSSARAIQRAYRRWSRHPRVLSRLRRHGAPPSSRNVAVWRRRIVDRCDEAQLAVSALELQRRQTSRSLARGVERVDDALKALAILRRLGG